MRRCIATRVTSTEALISEIAATKENEGALLDLELVAAVTGVSPSTENKRKDIQKQFMGSCVLQSFDFRPEHVEASSVERLAAIVRQNNFAFFDKR